jgi:hypothetical protein
MRKSSSPPSPLTRKVVQAFFSYDPDEAPEFPAKVIIGSLSPSLIRDRKKKLGKYLESICKLHDVINSHLFRNFIKFPHNGIPNADPKASVTLTFPSCRTCGQTLAAVDQSAGFCNLCRHNANGQVA